MGVGETPVAELVRQDLVPRPAGTDDDERERGDGSAAVHGVAADADVGSSAGGAEVAGALDGYPRTGGRWR